MTPTTTTTTTTITTNRRTASAVAPAIGALLLLLVMSSALGVRGLPVDNVAAKPGRDKGNAVAETHQAEVVVSATYGVAGESSQEGEHSATTDSGRLSFKLPMLLPAPAKTAESVNLEHEAIPSKILSLYDNSHLKVKDLTHPVPILDIIDEGEKYGNNGDMFDGISRAIVNGYEAFSNLLNTAIQKPKELARSISRGITAQLDIIGGKLVGL